MWYRFVTITKTVHTTIFSTPVLTPVLRRVARLLLQACNWRVEGRLPDQPKLVVLGAPHTSNWDFVLLLALALELKANPRYLGKAELFRSPLAFFFRWCGGVPVDRSKPNGLVEQMVLAMNRTKQLMLVIAPQGTRGTVQAWKTGFYHIAREADVPVVLAYIDSARKTIGIGPTFAITGNMENDIRSMQSFYGGMQGINPARVALLKSAD
jgi:1-acyl-sn-glycerol-3-phosphate acyltransferase